MRLGVFVGSFNPVHEGHIKVVNYLLDNNYVDKVLLLATPDYWEKKALTPIEDRVQMLRYYENDRIIVDNIHNKYPYTFQVIRSLKADYNDELYLIIGADNIINFDKWQHIDELLENKIIVLNRNNINIEQYLDKYDRSKFIVLSEFPFIDISSTEIRKGNYEYLHPKVIEYIKEHNLYKGE